ncbi:MAG: J domain-containing protein [Candidatus Obscuribacterales bacterium]|nr:J domain-containing protein [Candidatus Obscuribacterales bacterium]
MSWQPPPPPPKPGPGQQGPGPQPGPQGPAPAGGPQKQTFYDLLQVSPTAHPTIIRYSYRFLAGIYHPDNAETGNAEIFRQISEAFKTLSDSGKRMAYDAALGPALKKEADAAAAGPGAPAAKGPGPLPHIEKTSLSYNEIELRLAILQLLLQARKKRVQTGGCSAKTLMDVLGTEMGEMEFALWYMREKGYIERQEAQFMITVAGVDYIVDSLTKTQIIDEGPKNVPNYKAGGSSPNLPIISR